MSGVNGVVALLEAVSPARGRPAASRAPSDSVEAFRAALDRPVPSSANNDLAGGASLALADEGLIGRVRVADDILSGMDKLSASFGDAANVAAGVAERFASGGFSSTEWLNAQSTLSAMMLQYDIASKVVGKAVQSLDTLLKSQ
ncbi:type III secretion system major needle protein, YscF/MxiH/PrgI family [Bradyrhizobium yuanmingense]|uniref:Type III secretion system major needle protein, YscF/MxiH/PrgI family n=1 Tax=Bradyrhizobium yuanmingense TaxID=108015 RepID=A0A1C3XKV4_9BRAD|nr:EscI/YscI/HrpB family type III secretion system inner rod protein [Bradyrhizobium yuanmingense]TWI16606.1 type III secretion system (T3SS) basal body protein I (YscI/HrpB/PscI-like) [Bradyrhizobium yuanmingense]SCB52890.1 type III secretion system major needle protein, YscF/MxiH/PrgI family [Bradyrhizobium yuanmingense]